VNRKNQRIEIGVNVLSDKFRRKLIKTDSGEGIIFNHGQALFNEFDSDRSVTVIGKEFSDGLGSNKRLAENDGYQYCQRQH